MVLPIKRFDLAKRRLEQELAGTLRATLAEAMAGDVLEALGQLERVEATVVVSRDPRALALAQEHEALVVDDPSDANHSGAARLGVALALAIGYERALLVPGDCPLLAPRELDALLERHAPGAGVTIVPDRHGTGTNALLLSPPDAIEPSFGPGSAGRHQGLAAVAGVSAVIERVPSLELDVDTPEDLAALRALLSGASRGARTRAVLERR